MRTGSQCRDSVYVWLLSLASNLAPTDAWPGRGRARHRPRAAPKFGGKVTRYGDTGQKWIEYLHNDNLQTNSHIYDLDKLIALFYVNIFNPFLSKAYVLQNIKCFSVPVMRCVRTISGLKRYIEPSKTHIGLTDTLSYN